LCLRFLSRTGFFLSGTTLGLYLGCLSAFAIGFGRFIFIGTPRITNRHFRRRGYGNSPASYIPYEGLELPLAPVISSGEVYLTQVGYFPSGAV